VLLHGAFRDDKRFCDGVVRAAFGHQAEHLALARRDARQRVGSALAAQQPRDDLRVECGAAVRDAADRVHEPVDVADPVLEQVAETFGAVRQEL
jgi:hypothetical protein